MLSSLITLVAFLIILSILIFIHELGHFAVAKWSGITVEEFAIGFPPRAVKLWQDEGSITLDGHEFVISSKTEVSRQIQVGSQIYAETTVDEKGRPMVTKLEAVEPEPTGETENSQKSTLPWQSKLAAAEGRPTITVEALIRPTEYSINMVPLGGYVRMVGEEDPTDPGSFASKSKRVRLAVLAAGSAMNLFAAIFFFTLTSMAGVPEETMSLNSRGEDMPIARTIILAVMPDTPAEAAGLQAKDVVLGTTDGVEFTHVGDLVFFVNEHKGKTITLKVQRNNEILELPITPRLNPPPGQGAVGIGLEYDTDTKVVYYSPPQALARGVKDTATYVGLTFYVPYAIFQNIIPAEAIRPTGPKGIYDQTGAAVQATMDLQTLYPVLWFTAVLSAALAVTNMLPLPALDGGRIFFILIEAIRGKRISPEREGAIHLVGLGLLLTLMVIITFFDFSDPVPAIPWNNIFN